MHIFVFAHRYFEKIDSLLWPQFDRILELNVVSIRDCDPSKLGNIDVMPHYVCNDSIENSC